MSISTRVLSSTALALVIGSAPACSSSSDDTGDSVATGGGQGGSISAGGQSGAGGASGASHGAGGHAGSSGSSAGGSQAGHAGSGAGGAMAGGNGGSSTGGAISTGGGGSGHAGQGGSAAGGNAGASMGGSAGAATGGNGGSASGGNAGSAQGGSGGAATGRPFPDTTKTTGILADELPSSMTAAQQQFAATHFVGTQKLLVEQSAPLRAINPGFLVLHYHLGIWQSAPGVNFIVDGHSWGNDFPTVDMHESWFFHNASSQRLASNADGKLLMNLNDPELRAYWASSIVMQAKLGDYDGVFADSSSPALLQAEVGAQDARLAGTGARDSALAEWGGKTYIEVWNGFMAELDAALAAEGIPLIPNQGSFVTGWDTSNYGQTAGVFSEGFASPSFSASDWQASTTELLSLSASKILILQNYLSGPDDLATRRYYLANYLLVRGARTYLDYFDDGGPLEWFPEWGIDTGAPLTTATTAADLKTSDGIYRRDFEKAVALVNPGDTDVMVSLGASMNRVEPQGGGAVDASGAIPGTLSSSPVTQILVPAHGAEVLLH